MLLNTALCHYLRRHCAKMGPVPPAVLEDIASAKALDLFVKSELNQWSLAGRTAPELCGYLSAVARNGLVEYLREARRHVPLADSAGGSSDGSAEEARVTRASAEQGPDRVLERREFALALRDCLEQLESRPRRMWLFRVFYEMSSKEIAVHPEFQLTPANVDVILHRTREVVSRCINSKGYARSDVREGVFAELWSAFSLPPVPAGAGSVAAHPGRQ
ncbi:MAG TPA: hypothetical protein VI504_11980 [Candidatus Eisenbacteria bacterium]